MHHACVPWHLVKTRLRSEDEQMCAYSHDAALCNYSFLVRWHVPSKSPVCTWKKYTSATPSGLTDAEYPACMHTVSAICLWATVLVYNTDLGYRPRCKPLTCTGVILWRRGELGCLRVPGRTQQGYNICKCALKDRPNCTLYLKCNKMGKRTKSLSNQRAKMGAPQVGYNT